MLETSRPIVLSCDCLRVSQRHEPDEKPRQTEGSHSTAAVDASLLAVTDSCMVRREYKRVLRQREHKLRRRLQTVRAVAAGAEGGVKRRRRST